jgi:hypothetical protein
MNRPQANEHAPFYAKYIERVSEDVIEELREQSQTIPSFLRLIPQEKIDFSYSDGKWTIKEVVGHMIDTERMMAYRLLRFSRKDNQPLLGFDENEYVKNSRFFAREFESLIDEFASVRKSNLFLFNSLTQEDLALSGIANGQRITVKALLFVMAGHAKHHLEIIKERYL